MKPGKSAWQAYIYKASLDSPSASPKQDPIYVAMGWSGSDATLGFDNIAIEMRAAP
jgi:hypothetical protein